MTKRRHRKTTAAKYRKSRKYTRKGVASKRRSITHFSRNKTRGGVTPLNPGLMNLAELEVTPETHQKQPAGNQVIQEQLSRTNLISAFDVEEGAAIKSSQ